MSTHSLNPGMDQCVEITQVRLDHLEAIDTEEKKFEKLSLTSEKFLKFIHKFFDTINSFMITILILFFIANAYDYNFFPFEVEPPNGWLYQVGQCLFLISFGASDILTLRIVLVFGNVFLIAEFVRFRINFDFLIYTLIAIVINTKKIMELLYKRRPIIFDSYREQIYEELFEDFMDRDEFQVLTRHSLLRDIQKGGYFVRANDRCQTLTILLHGRMQLLKGSMPEGEHSVSIGSGTSSDESKPTDVFIEANEFLDSSEWLLREMQVEQERRPSARKTEKKKKPPRGKRFTYDIRAVVNCKYISWPRELLIEQLQKNPELKSKLTAVLGLDVSHKVFQMNSFY